MTGIPHSPDIEERVVGAALIWPGPVEAVTTDLSPEDFYTPKWALAWGLIVGCFEKGLKPDARLIVEQARGRIEMADMIEATCTEGTVQRQHVETLLAHSAARRVIQSCKAALDSLVAGEAAWPTIDTLQDQIESVREASTSGAVESVTMSDLIKHADDSAPWVVPGLLRTDWRAVVVGGEGVGKGVLLRQIAMLAAQGLHPFRFTKIEPKRTWIADLENPRAAIAETAGPMDEQLRRTVGADYDGSRCRLWHHREGIDLRSRASRAELRRELNDFRPDLVCLGPVYKSFRRVRGEGYEDAADDAQAILDELRTRYNFALVLEHHAAKGKPGEQRTMDPMGSQRWMAWPEFGFSLVQPDRNDRTRLSLGRNRYDRLRNDWPASISWGSVWPWEGTWPKRKLEPAAEMF